MIQKGYKKSGIVTNALLKNTKTNITQAINGVAKIGNAVKMAKAKMLFGQSYFVFNFLANGYAIIGYTITHNREDAKKNMINSILQSYGLSAEYQRNTSQSLTREMQLSRMDKKKEKPPVSSI